MRDGDSFRYAVFMINRKKIKKLLLVSLFAAGSLQSACAGSEDFALCAKKFPSSDAERLKCFDSALAARTPSETAVSAEKTVAMPTTAAASAENTPRAERSYLTRVWNLDNRTRRDQNSLDRLQPHRQSYLIVRKSSNANNLPGSPAPGHTALTPVDMDALEAKFQLSFKSDIATLGNLDILGLKTVRFWGAYTQQSQWQVFNTRNSSPFRETNYEPELIAAFGTGKETGWKLLNLGLVHQSNGRSLPDSRSWNRAYVQGGWEWDHTSLLARAWYRIPETVVKDDNPDIAHYIGRAELVARWEPDSKAQAVSLLLRNNLNLNANIGFMQLDWSIPVALGKAARLHAQYTDGYGESMIDYNHRQRTLGLGVSFREW